MRLLNRTTRSVSLTDAGLRLATRLRPAIDQITEALDDLNEERERPFGHLRIYATHMAAAVIVPVWQRFLSRCPNVHLEVQAGEAAIDIVARGFDAGIGPRDRAAADMVALRVTGPVKVAVVAAPSYFALHSAPRSPVDLASHNCVQYRRATDGIVIDWAFVRQGKSRKVSTEGRIMADDPDLALRAAVDGLGIAYTIEALADPFLRSGQLIRVLEEWSPGFEGLFLYHPSGRRIPAALRAFIDIVRANQKPDPSGTRASNPFAEA